MDTFWSALCEAALDIDDTCVDSLPEDWEDMLEE
jgi:hypothetical protein